jgi:hypothetical protein
MMERHPCLPFHTQVFGVSLLPKYGNKPSLDGKITRPVRRKKYCKWQRQQAFCVDLLSVQMGQT